MLDGGLKYSLRNQFKEREDCFVRQYEMMDIQNSKVIKKLYLDVDNRIMRSKPNTIGYI